MAREQQYILEARQQAQKLWAVLFDMEKLQQEWHSMEYGNNLPDGEGSNEGVTKAEVGSFVIDTCNELRTRITQTAHSANIARLL